MAETLLKTGDCAQAFDRAQRSLEMAEELDDGLKQANAHKVLGQVLLAQGKGEQARAHLRQALEIAQACEGERLEMVAEITALLARLENA